MYIYTSISCVEQFSSAADAKPIKIWEKNRKKKMSEVEKLLSMNRKAADRYLKREVLGEGTYGVVYKAIDTKVTFFFFFFFLYIHLWVFHLEYLVVWVLGFMF